MSFNYSRSYEGNIFLIVVDQSRIIDDYVDQVSYSVTIVIFKVVSLRWTLYGT